MTAVRPLRVAIDARVSPGAVGGIAQAALALVHALGRLDDDPTEYVVVVQDEAGADFMRPVLGPNQRLVVRPSAAAGFGARILDGVSRRLGRPAAPAIGPALSDGFYEGLGVDVVHFPHQAFVLTSLPAVYNPHDLQHHHYPQFFTPESIAWRFSVYEAACKLSATVVVASQWVKDDVLTHFHVDPARVQVIPWGSPTVAYERPSDDECVAILARHGVVRPFLFYPAVTWPHKNHLSLLEALAVLREQRGLTLRLVCTGSQQTAHWPAIEAAVIRLGLESQVSFLGYVPERDLRALYASAQALLMPTLFESDSFPIFEAWFDGLPVVCSDVTSLPDQVQDAGLIFTPDEQGIADALARIATDEALRADLRERGFRRLGDYSWDRTARAYRAVYRRAAGRRLDAAEEELLRWDWMRFSSPPDRQG